MKTYDLSFKYLKAYIYKCINKKHFIDRYIRIDLSN